MSDVESSEDEVSDIDKCVSMAYEKLTEDNSATEAENSESPVLSPRTPAVAIDSEDDSTSPNSNEATDVIWFVTSTYSCLN